MPYSTPHVLVPADRRSCQQRRPPSLKPDHAEAAEERGGEAKVGRNSECRTPNSVLQTMCYHPGGSPGLSPAKTAYPGTGSRRGRGGTRREGKSRSEFRMPDTGFRTPNHVLSSR